MNARSFSQLIAAVCGFASGSISIALHAQQREFAALDEFVDSFVKDQQVPGVVLAVTYAGRLVYARGYGYADAAQQRPVGATDLFRIASISKAITATTIMQLIRLLKPIN